MNCGEGGCCQYNERMNFPPKFDLNYFLFSLMVVFFWAWIFALRYWQYLCAGKYEDPRDVRKWGWISGGLIFASLLSAGLFILRL